jgi:hypothetical protein
VATKIDLGIERKIREEDGRKIAEKYQMEFI